MRVCKVVIDDTAGFITTTVNNIVTSSLGAVISFHSVTLYREREREEKIFSIKNII